MSETKELTFESGYERLSKIAARLNETEVPVSEMCDLFAEGKGLEQALKAYLDKKRERVEEIERGQGIRAFKITSSPAAESSDLDADSEIVPPSTYGSPSIADEDIPF